MSKSIRNLERNAEAYTGELVASGVPKDHIVLAFHPPEVRQPTGYAIA
ncbi:element excision factor XisI family protein [Microcoleus sp. LAD1_D3]